MTDKLCETLNLPRLEDALKELGNNAADHENASAEVEAMAAALENATPSVISSDEDGVEDHATEMDEIHETAMKAHGQLMVMGFNVEAKHAGSIFNPAGKFLEIALKASRSKSDQKLALVKMKMEKEKQDAELRKNVVDGTIGDDGIPTGQLMDRNELMKLYKQGSDTSGKDS